MLRRYSDNSEMLSRYSEIIYIYTTSFQGHRTLVMNINIHNISSVFRFCIIHEVCLAHILTAVFPIGSDTSLPHVCEANYVRDPAD